MSKISGGNNITKRITEELGAAIVTNRYTVANPFPVEAELCKQFGASRSVLREAVKMLTAKGLLKARPRQGTWVQARSAWNLLDPDVLRWTLSGPYSLDLMIEITQVRHAIEPSAAGLAALKACDDGKAAIGAALGRMMAATKEEDDPLGGDIEFHSAIIAASGNSFYASMTELIETALRFSIRRTNAYKGVSYASVLDHKKVADAIFEGNAPAAEAAMRSLIKEALDLLLSEAQAGGN